MVCRVTGSADAVDDEAAVRLEVLERMRGQRAEDAVDLAAVEPETAEIALQAGDIVAAQVRRGEEQQPVAQTPRRFDESGPGVLATDAVDSEAASLLEGAARTQRSSNRKSPPRRPAREGTRRRRGGVASRGQLRRAGPESGGSNQKFVELLE